MNVTYAIELVNFNQNTQLADVMQALHNIFTDIVNRLLKNYNVERTRAVIIIEDRAGRLDSPIIVPLQRLNNYSADLILGHISAVSQSKKELRIDSEIVLTLGTITLPDFAGYNKLIHITNDRITCLEKKKYIHVFPIRDNNCFVRSITYCFHMLQNPNFWKSRNKLKQGNFERYALAMSQKCKIKWDTAVSLAEIPRIENILNVRIIIAKFKSTGLGFEVVYSGNEEFQPKAYLLAIPPYQNNTLHLLPIRDAKKLFWSNDFKQHHCYVCNEIVREIHICKTGLTRQTCLYCRERQCAGWESGTRVAKISCILCCYSFLDEGCYTNHTMAKRKKKSLCMSRYKCYRCHSSCNHVARDMHRCNYRYCSTCKGMYLDSIDSPHFCFMRIPKVDKKRQDRILCYDIEASMNSKAECDEPDIKRGKCQNCQNTICSQMIHKALVIASFSCCEMCRGKWNSLGGKGSVCNTCGIRCAKCEKTDGICSPRRVDRHGNWCGSRRVIFYGENCVGLFMNYVIDERRRGFVAYAHNAACYDHMSVRDISYISIINVPLKIVKMLT